MDYAFFFVAGTAFGGFTAMWIGRQLFDFFNNLEELPRETS